MGFFFKKTKPSVDLSRDGVRCRSGAHEEGSISDLFADNPLARAALEGAGLDPDRVAREADAARRSGSDT